MAHDALRNDRPGREAMPGLKRPAIPGDAQKIRHQVVIVDVGSGDPELHFEALFPQ